MISNNSEVKSILYLGILASLIFSTTFVLNRWLSSHGDHWYWTASLRYFFVLIFLSLYLIKRKGLEFVKDIYRCFKVAKIFWIVIGGIGFGLFYLLISYASAYAPAWILATTWQSTILMTPIITWVLGGKSPKKSIIFLLIMFIGVVLININEFHSLTTIDLKFIFPILLAAICYPLGNTICKYACEGKYKKYRTTEFEVAKNVFAQIMLMTIGAVIFMMIAGLVLQPPPPSPNQIIGVSFVAILTGIIATGLLFKARKKAGNNQFALAAADSTQVMESPFTLIWEYLTLGIIINSFKGIIGLILVVIGLLLFIYYSNSDS